MDLMSLTNEQFRWWLDAYQTGYLHGLERGGDLRDDEWDARFSTAVGVVHAAAGWPDRSRSSQVKKRPGRDGAKLGASSSPWPPENGTTGEGEGA